MRPLFQFFDTTPLSELIRQSRFLFPLLECIHLLALTVLFGAVIVLNLRLMGLGLRRQSIAAVARSLAPITFRSLLVMLGSGFLLFISEALKCYDNPPFFFKVGMLFLALTFHGTVVRRLAAQGEAAHPTVSFAAAALSLLLWFSVAAGGRRG
jgi:hypothetical protein